VALSGIHDSDIYQSDVHAQKVPKSCLLLSGFMNQDGPQTMKVQIWIGSAGYPAPPTAKIGYLTPLKCNTDSFFIDLFSHFTTQLLDEIGNHQH